MKLRWSPRSPFVRKVMIVLYETQLMDHVELVRNVVAVHLPPNPDVVAVNPLGKIPALIADEGTTLVDSRVICEYLDGLGGTGLFPATKDERFRHLRWQALADGLTDILLLWRTELLREAGPWDAITSGWRVKTQATMNSLEQEAEELGKASFGIGHIAVICALGQMDFRWSDCQWRDHFRELAGLEKTWSERSSIKATQIVNDDLSGTEDVTLNQLWFEQESKN